MKETIGIRLNELISKYVDIYLAEAETEEYPYAVYTSDITPVYVKDGIHHYQADVVITVYAKDLDIINPIVDNILDDVAADMSGGKFSARLTRDHPDCMDGVWSRELNYTINQYQ